MKGEFYKMEYEAWDGDTEDLTIEQEGAYLRLIHQMYRRRKAVPNDVAALSRLWRCHQNKARPIIRALLDSGKIQLTEDGLLTNSRVRRELDARETLSTQRADAGKTGGRRSADTRQTPPRHSQDTPETPLRHSADTQDTFAKKTNEINAREQPIASTATKPIQAEKSREEEKREEESREDVVASEIIDLPPLPWEVAPADQAAPAMPATRTPEKVYAFEAGIIKLTETDFDRWRVAYPNINLAGELTSMADWASRLKAEGKNWFTVIPNQLIKLERTAKREREESRMTIEARAKQGARSAPGRPAI